MKIIVLTPVKNEDWILDRFLTVTSNFADHIIILDQNSSDSSRRIAEKYSKVILLDNASQKYDESSRQLILINKARELFPGDKILLALDADEILAADALNSIGWQTMLKAQPGTVLYFEKPDLYLTPHQAIRYNNLWPLGYVDDGAEHKPLAIHSIRIPQPEYAIKLYLHDIKILHYSLNRIDFQISKTRYYSMLENLVNKNHFLNRRRIYNKDFDYVSNNVLMTTPTEWFKEWEARGIDMKSIQSKMHIWYNEEAIKLFELHGSKKFWLDNIWDADWETIKKNNKISISRPPSLLILALKILDRLYQNARKLI